MTLMLRSSLIDFQTRRRSRTLRTLGILAVIVYVIWQFISFQLSLTQLPATWRIADESFKDLPIDVALQQVSIDLQQPIALQYFTNTITLQPGSIDFALDADQTALTIHALRSQNALIDFMRRLIFQPPAPRDVAITASYSTEKVRAALAEFGSQLDQPAQPAKFQIDPANAIAHGQDGYQLNIIQSMKPIDAALKSATQREVTLVIEHQLAPPPSIDQLQQYIKDRIAPFPANASVFIKALQTGQEIDLNPNVAYSGLGVMKIAIMVETFRKLDDAPDVTTTLRLTTSIVAENNFSANSLVQLIGDNDLNRGVDIVSASLHNLGLANTFMLAAYGYTSTLPTLITPANSITTTHADPDPYMQTTASDTGLLLEAIYQCHRNGGMLMVVYPDKFTSNECDQILNILKQTDPNAPSALRGGLLAGTSIAHKIGANADTRADASIVFSPGGDFVLVVFFNTPNQPLEWSAVNPIMADVARTAYQFFNP
ncbi:MAG TPA: serine hydrolase [Anaerolineae bacterium]|nr:serine hydrolase [Anaerolineae bacterium]